MTAAGPVWGPGVRPGVSGFWSRATGIWIPRGIGGAWPGTSEIKYGRPFAKVSSLVAFATAGFSFPLLKRTTRMLICAKPAFAASASLSASKENALFFQFRR